MNFKFFWCSNGHGHLELMSSESDGDCSLFFWSICLQVSIHDAIVFGPKITHISSYDLRVFGMLNAMD